MCPYIVLIHSRQHVLAVFVQGQPDNDLVLARQLGPGRGKVMVVQGLEALDHVEV